MGQRHELGPRRRSRGVEQQSNVTRLGFPLVAHRFPCGTGQFEEARGLVLPVLEAQYRDAELFGHLDCR